MTITLTARQASTLWWLLEGTSGATYDATLNRVCIDVARKLEKAGMDKALEYVRQERRK